MSFADEKPRSIMSAWGKDKITLAEACSCGDLVAIDSGNNWDLAEGSTPKLAIFVAGEAGAIGDEITVYKGAVIRGEGSTGFAAASGEIGDLVFLSDTAGEYSTSRGTREQPVGFITKTNEIHVDIFDAVREATAIAGKLVLNGIAFMQTGEYGTPVEDSRDTGGDGLAFHELWAKVTHASARGYAQRLYMEASGLTARTGNALRAEFLLSHASGHAAGGGAGVHGTAELAVDNDGVAGILAGLSGSIIVASQSRSLAGTYAALVLQTEFKASNTMPPTTSFIWFNDAGTVKAPFFLDFAALATGAARAYVAGTHAGTTVGGVLRVRTPFGTGYIKLFSD